MSSTYKLTLHQRLGDRLGEARKKSSSGLSDGDRPVVQRVMAGSGVPHPVIITHRRACRQGHRSMRGPTALGVAHREPSMLDTLQQHGTTVRAVLRARLAY
jgi:hypothetical protein